MFDSLVIEISRDVLSQCCCMQVPSEIVVAEVTGILVCPQIRDHLVLVVSVQAFVFRHFPC